MYPVGARYHHHRDHRRDLCGRLDQAEPGYRCAGPVRCCVRDRKENSGWFQPLRGGAGGHTVRELRAEGRRRCVDRYHDPDLHVRAHGHSVLTRVLHVGLLQQQSEAVRATAGVGVFLRYRPDPVLLHGDAGHGRSSAGSRRQVHGGASRYGEQCARRRTRWQGPDGVRRQARHVGTAADPLDAEQRSLDGGSAGGVRAGGHAVHGRGVHVHRWRHADARSVEALRNARCVARCAEALGSRWRWHHRRCGAGGCYLLRGRAGATGRSGGGLWLPDVAAVDGGVLLPVAHAPRYHLGSGCRYHCGDLDRDLRSDYRRLVRVDAAVGSLAVDDPLRGLGHYLQSRHRRDRVVVHAK